MRALSDAPVLPAAPAGLPATVDAKNPWPGLAAFQEGDCGFFHGRERAVEALDRHLERGRLTVLYGKSGLGKTSLVRAGLFPRLREEDLLPVYIRLDYGGEPPDLGGQVRRAFTEAAEAARVEMPPPRSGETLWELLHRQGAQLWSPHNRAVTPVFVFDQFEEIFTLGRRPGLAKAREAFLTELADLVEGRPPREVKARLDAAPREARAFNFQHHRYRVLLSLREDFLSDLEDLEERMPSLLSHNFFRLRSMTGADALRVVAGAGGPLVTPGVAELIVRFVAAAEEKEEEPGPLAGLEVDPALLSVICRELNDRRREQGLPQITAGLLEGQGGSILAGFYERGLAGLGPQVRHFVEERLVTETGFRDTVALENALKEPGVTAEAIDRLIEQRILRKEGHGERQRLELTHDRLTGVIRESRDARRLREAEERAETVRREAEAERVREQKLQSLKLFRTVAAILAVSLAVAVGLAGWAIVQTARANRALSRDHVHTALEESRGGSANRALAELAAAMRLDRNNVAARSVFLDLLPRHNWPLLERVLDAGSTVYDAELSPDGTRIAAASEDGFLRLWDSTGRRIAEEDHHPDFDEQVNTALFSPDGRYVVTTSNDKTAAVWNAADGTLVRRLEGHGAEVRSASFSPESDRVLTSSWDGTAGLWQIPQGPTVWLKGHEDRKWLRSARFSRDGSLVVTGSNDWTARLWDRSGRQVAVCSGHQGSVRSAEISPDRHWIATASRDGTARLWELDLAQQPQERCREAHVLKDPDSPGESVLKATFRPDGRRVLTMAGRVARLWDLEGRPVGLPMRHEELIHSARFSPSGLYVATAAEDRTARIWDGETGAPLSGPMLHAGWVFSAKFDERNEQRILTASQDHRVRLWRWRPPAAARGPAAGRTLRLQSPVTSARFSPDGRRIATVAAGGRAAVWDAATGRRLGELDGGTIRSAFFSPDGRSIVTAADRTVRFWETRTLEPLGEPIEPGGLVGSVLLSPDGRRMLTRAKRSVRLWGAPAGFPLGKPLLHRSKSGQPAEITSAEFSPDGNRVVTTGKDGRARVWDSWSAKPLAQVDHTTNVRLARFDPAGRRLLTVYSEGHELSLWDLESFSPRRIGEPILVTGSVVAAEWSPDGRGVLIAAGTAAEIRSAETGLWTGRRMQHESGIVAAFYTPEGSRVVTAAQDGTLRLWSAETGERIDEPLTGSGSSSPALCSLDLSRDGQRLRTVTKDGTVRRLEIPAGSPADAEAFADLAEVLSVEAGVVLLPDPAGRLRHLCGRRAGLPEPAGPVLQGLCELRAGSGREPTPPRFSVHPPRAAPSGNGPPRVVK